MACFLCVGIGLEMCVKFQDPENTSGIAAPERRIKKGARRQKKLYKYAMYQNSDRAHAQLTQTQGVLSIRTKILS